MDYLQQSNDHLGTTLVRQYFLLNVMEIQLPKPWIRIVIMALWYYEKIFLQSSFNSALIFQPLRRTLIKIKMT